MRLTKYLSLCFLLYSCNEVTVRAPGPGAAETGLTFLWDLEDDGTRTINARCPRGDSFDSFYNVPTDFLKAGTNLIYVIADDGQSAALQDCQQRNCEPSNAPPLVINGHLLSGSDSSSMVVDTSTSGDSCSLLRTRLFSLEDKGENLMLTIGIRYGWDGQCDNYINYQVLTSTNSQDLTGCELSFRWAATLLGTRDDSQAK